MATLLRRTLLVLSLLAPAAHSEAGPLAAWPQGEVTVPSNARFLVEYGGRGSTGSGALVMDGPLVDTYLPEVARFESLAVYDLAGSSTGTPPFVTVRADGEPRLTANITFSDVPDLEPPSKPTLQVQELHMVDQDGHPYASVFARVVDPDPDAVGWILFKDGIVSQGSLFLSKRLGATLNLAGQNCYTATLIDGAGNRSEHSASYCTSQGGCTCASPRRHTFTAWILAGAVLLLGRRRCRAAPARCAVGDH